MNYTIKPRSTSFRILFLPVFSLIILAGLACSPAAVILTHKPELAKSTYKYFTDRAEIKIAKSPEDPKRLIEGCKYLTQYGFGFTMEEADRLVMNDYKEGTILYVSANQMFAKAVLYGDRALEIKYPGYLKWIQGEKKSAPNFTYEDIHYLFWTAGAYGGAIKSSRGNPEWVILLPRVGKLLESALVLDSDWNKGALYSGMISYTMIRHDAPADKIELAEFYFKKAVEASDGLDLGPYVAMAESVCIPTQNKNEFTNLLYKALNIDINSVPDLRLTNQINRNRTQWLLDNIDEYFY